MVRQVRRQTGFDGVQVFRKYLWFLLRERKFDQSAVDDMILLKSAFGLTDADVRLPLIATWLPGWPACLC